MNLDIVQNYEVPPIDHVFSVKDTMLYALGLGYGSDPLDESQIAFVYEDGLKPVPSLCNTLAHPGFWIKEPSLEIDWVKVHHAEQSFVMHRPLHASGAVRGRYKILSVGAKGTATGEIPKNEQRVPDS